MDNYSYTSVVQNQLEVIYRLQLILLARIKSGNARNDSSEIASYLTLIEKALPLFGILPKDVEQADTTIQLNQLLSLILEDQLPKGDLMIDQSRYDEALAKLKSDASADAADKAALAEAKAQLQSAQDSVGSLQGKVDQLSADDAADKAALAQAQADLEKAKADLAAAEEKTNALIDQILPVDQTPVVTPDPAVPPVM